MIDGILRSGRRGCPHPSPPLPRCPRRPTTGPSFLHRRRSGRGPLTVSKSSRRCAIPCWERIERRDREGRGMVCACGVAGVAMLFPRWRRDGGVGSDACRPKAELRRRDVGNTTKARVASSGSNAARKLRRGQKSVVNKN